MTDAEWCIQGFIPRRAFQIRRRASHNSAGTGSPIWYLTACGTGLRIATDARRSAPGIVNRTCPATWDLSASTAHGFAFRNGSGVVLLSGIAASPTQSAEDSVDSAEQHVHVEGEKD